jgi:tRNA A37 threonylcarbamoyladenosine dehydratase
VTQEADLERRFGGVRRLYGEAAAHAFGRARFAVIGVGGVGSWTVEALARSHVGALTLIDLDMIAESNTNRQIQALDDAYGMAKAAALGERVRAIDPSCRVRAIEDFVTAENVTRLLAREEVDVVIDAMDDARDKAAIIAHCRRTGIALVTVGAAGGQVDPTCIRRNDLARTTQDPLLARVRACLRREHGFPAASGKPGRRPKPFGIPAIYSTETLRRPQSTCAPEANGMAGANGAAGTNGMAGTNGITGLNCAGFGSSVCVTAPMGFAAAATALDLAMSLEFS